MIRPSCHFSDRFARPVEIPGGRTSGWQRRVGDRGGAGNSPDQPLVIALQRQVAFVTTCRLFFVSAR